MKISIKKFKKIDDTTVDLAPVNVFIGANNSGKSSFIQGIQFAVSGCQTLLLKRTNWTKNKSKNILEKKLALDSTDFLYAPTRYIENLYHGQKLTGSRTRGTRKSMSFSFDDRSLSASIEISKGKNGGFTTIMTGKTLGDDLSSIENPFCVYVPGIAGIPIQEKFEVPIAIKKSATRGDSNNYLRNIISNISLDAAKWSGFIESVNKVYSDVAVKVIFNQDVSEFIEINVINDGNTLPIDSVGTGLLQTLQAFAYIEYFNPRIILLDEPDAHIHPTKQKLLANELLKRAEANSDLRVVFSTHSRYILEALEGKAKVFHFNHGNALPDVKEGKILLDIGAADADYLFSKKHLKYVIVTEDEVDNIEEKKNFIKKFALANGLTEDEFVLHSYGGCKNVESAKILKGFVAKQIPSVEVIIHLDRDQKLDNDTELLKLTKSCEAKGIKLFITELSEIENYFCTAEHIAGIYGINSEDAQDLYQSKIIELEEFTKNKMSNFLLRERPELTLNKKGQQDIKTLKECVDNIYSLNKAILTPGKELMGKLKQHIQQHFGKSPQDILGISSALSSDKFKEVLK
ncbi:ATP-dependent nuclease [Hymenobacter elongatus]|uniref:ATP-binding protein n=1 Tax=Hymenobacter elongatus TaxID=877208 RepID=A0A4Z0PN61_9BACT|nr:ATP-binding protein [Hymenobacter elongatus]TGE17404.1 ATP-binding protein [Hymenobacter elongatus]